MTAIAFHYSVDSTPTRLQQDIARVNKTKPIIVSIFNAVVLSIINPTWWNMPINNIIRLCREIERKKVSNIPRTT